MARFVARVKQPHANSGMRIVHNKLLGGWLVVRGKHQAPLSTVFATKQQALIWLAQRCRR
jgi:hypothetical protein